MTKNVTDSIERVCPFCGDIEMFVTSTPSNDGTITWRKLHHAPESDCSVSLTGRHGIPKLIGIWNDQID